MFNSHRVASKIVRDQARTVRLQHTGTWRMYLLVIAVFVAFGSIYYRLYNLTLIHHDDYTKTAELQRQNAAALSKRGSIFISDDSQTSRVVVSTNKTSNILYSNNTILTGSIIETSKKLAVIMGLDPKVIEVKLNEAGKTYDVLT